MLARMRVPLACLAAALIGAGRCGQGAASAAESQPAPLPAIRVASNGRTLETEDGQPFVPFGVNYYRPGTGWAPQLWKKFDPIATRADFARLKKMGANCARVFLTYGSFCSEPETVSAEGLAKFDQMLALAEEAGLYLHPTGPDHWEGTPPWVRQEEDIAGDRRLAGLEAFWKQFAARYRGRPALFAYDLRNEPEVPWTGPNMQRKWNAWLAGHYAGVDKAATAWGSNAASLAWGQVPPPPTRDALTNRLLLDYQRFREELADEWTRRQVRAIKAADPRALVTVGLIQWSVPALLPGIQHYAAFRPSRQARFLDFMEVHFYPLNKGFYTYANPEDEERNLAYLESVVREVAAVGKPVVVAEFGWYGGGKPTIDQGRHPAASEEQQARWNRRLIETTAGLARGWLNWGFYDQPEATDVSQLTGLLTAEGKTKAWGREFEVLAEKYRGRAIPAAPPAKRPTLDWDRCVSSTRAGSEFREDYFRAWKAKPGE
jgi:endo-1,4-beta-mannosidase